MSTLRLLSLLTVSEEGGRVGGSDWSTSRDRADDGADGDSLLASLASGLGDIVTRSERAMEYLGPSYKQYEAFPPRAGIGRVR